MRRYTNNLFETGCTIVPKTMKSLKLFKIYKKYQIFYFWGDIVGKDLSKYIIPQKLDFSILYVYATSSVWANNFQYLKLDVIKKINTFLEYNLVKDIQFTRFRQKNINDFSPVLEKRVDLGKYVKKMPVEEYELVKIDDKVADIEDEELRNKLKKVYMKNLQLQKLKIKYGWIACKKCKRLTPAMDEYCIDCQRKIREDKRQKIAEILQAIPWASYKDIVKYINCNQDMVNKVRLNMVQELAANLKPDIDYPDNKTMEGFYSDNAKVVVMLYKMIAPNKLNDAVLHDVIKKIKYDTAYWEDKKNKYIKNRELNNR